MKQIVLKASFRGCPISDRKKFRDSKCIMPISIGQKVHEGDKFFATMQLINSYFKSCTLLIDDSIQRFTLKINEPHFELDELHIKAVSEGDVWLERNRHIYEKLTIPYEIKRWDDWRNHQDFLNSYNRIEALYNTDEDYKRAIHINIDDYINRYATRVSEIDFDREHAFDCCLKYLKEECAVMCLWPLEQFHFEVYPAGRNQAMVATYEKIIQPVHPHLLRSVALRFKKYIKNKVNE